MRRAIRFSALSGCMALLISVPLLLPATSRAMFSITIYFGIRRCEPGFGICRIDIGSAREASRESESRTAIRKGEASASVEMDKASRGAAGSYLRIDMKTALPRHESIMPVAEDLMLDRATSKALGHKSIKVLKGDYKIDYSKNNIGSLLLKIEVRD